MDIYMLALVLAVVIYYGGLRWLETGSRIADTEMQHLERSHQASIVTRSAKLDDKLDDDVVAKAASFQAKLDALAKPTKA